MPTGQASPTRRGRAEVMARRLAWFEAQLNFDPSKLVLIDETGVTTKMAAEASRLQLPRPAPNGHLTKASRLAVSLLNARRLSVRRALVQRRCLCSEGAEESQVAKSQDADKRVPV